MKKITLITFLVLLATMVSCSDEIFFGAVVQTLEADKIDSSGATLNGELLEIGTFPVVNLGFQISTDSTMVADDLVEVIQGPNSDNKVGVFSLSIDNLEVNTKYYFRAVAETEELPSFGDVFSFNTREE